MKVGEKEKGKYFKENSRNIDAMKRKKNALTKTKVKYQNLSTQKEKRHKKEMFVRKWKQRKRNT